MVACSVRPARRQGGREGGREGGKRGRTEAHVYTKEGGEDPDAAGEVDLASEKEDIIAETETVCHGGEVLNKGGREGGREGGRGQ